MLHMLSGIWIHDKRYRVVYLTGPPGDAGHSPHLGRACHSLDATGMFIRPHVLSKYLLRLSRIQLKLGTRILLGSTLCEMEGFDINISQIRGQGKTGLNFEEAYNVSKHISTLLIHD